MTCLVITIACLVSLSAAQTPEIETSSPLQTRGSSFEDVSDFELVIDEGLPDLRSSTQCRYFETSPGTFVEDCVSTEYTGGSVQVPKWSVPYQVQIITNKDGESDALLRQSFPDLELWQARHICSGSLIHENWILTAAHCIDENIQPNGYGIRLKADSISENLDDYIPAKAYFIHPDYESRPLENDVALIQLSTQGAPRKFQKYNPAIGTEKMPFWRAVLSKDGKRLVTRPPDEDTADIFTVWNADTGEIIYSLKKTDDILRYTDFNESAGLLYGVDAAGAWIFDIETDAQVRRISGTDRTFRINYLEKTNQFATFTRGNDVTIWERPSLAATVSFQIEFPLNGLKALRPGLYVLYDMTGHEYIYDISDQIARYAGGGMHYKLSPDGKTYVEIEGNKIRLRNTSSGEILKTSLIEGRSWSAWNTEDYFVVTDDAAIRIIDPSTLEDRLRIPTNKYQLREVIGDKAFALSSSNEFTAFKLGSGRMIGRVSLPEDDSQANDWKVFDGGKKLLIWRPEGKSKVWRVKDGKLLYEINHSLPVLNIEVSEDGKYLMSYSEFGPADIWSAKDGEPVNRVFHRGIQGLSYNSTLKKLVTWDHRGIARIWAVGTPQKLAEIDIKPLSPRIGNYPEIAIIDLAKTEPEDGTQLWAYGWGKTREIAKLEPVSVLRGISFSKISDDVCREKFGSARLELGADEICAFDADRKTCKGDSGGPIASIDRLVGVTSWGARSCNDETKQPSVMANVAYFRGWIKGIVCGDPGTNESPPAFCTD